MDLRAAIHSRGRADLPRSLRFAEVMSRLNNHWRIRPGVGTVLGVASFLGGGVLVITMASLLALSV